MGRKSGLVRSAYILLTAAVAVSCAKDQGQTNSSCAPSSPAANSGNTGAAMVFNVDPINASGITTLAPTSLSLDNYRSQVALSRLNGNGVLSGTYVDVRNNLQCQGSYGAYDQKNQFNYSRSDFRFQEAMAYYMGDGYRAYLNSIGELHPTSPVTLIAHAMADDNAYFTLHTDNNGTIHREVWLGDSQVTPGASYADDGIVTVHELQHSTTLDMYSGGNTQIFLNQLGYDEAGALNEAISDFMGLVYTQPNLISALDPRVFSRWALDRFFPTSRATRGAFKCPEYDSSFASGCKNFPSFSSDTNTISYVYPDGLGWPYANNYTGPDYARQAFNGFKSREEIHNVGVLMEGALWDVYSSIQANHSGDPSTAEKLMSKAVLEALKFPNLPLSWNNDPNSSLISPVNFRNFAQALKNVAPHVGMTDTDVNSLTQALTTRGLLGGQQLPNNWAAVGTGSAPSPGVFVQDNPSILKAWLYSMSSAINLATAVPQGIQTGLNNMLDPGETAVIWFDLKNTSAITAGSVNIDVQVSTPGVNFLTVTIGGQQLGVNYGSMTLNESQAQYYKVNGTSIVSALAGPNYPITVSNSYFGTNPSYSKNPTNGFWVSVAPSVAHGTVVNFTVTATPSNGPASTVVFPVKVN